MKKTSDVIRREINMQPLCESPVLTLQTAIVCKGLFAQHADAGLNGNGRLLQLCCVNNAVHHGHFLPTHRDLSEVAGDSRVVPGLMPHRPSREEVGNYKNNFTCILELLLTTDPNRNPLPGQGSGTSRFNIKFHGPQCVACKCIWYNRLTSPFMVLQNYVYK